MKKGKDLGAEEAVNAKAQQGGLSEWSSITKLKAAALGGARG